MMETQAWQEAVLKLLKTFGLNQSNISSEISQKNLDNLLLGSGIAAHQLHKGTPASVHDAIGALLNKEDGTWQAAIVEKGLIYAINETGSKGNLLNDSVSDNFINGWIFKKRKFEMPQFLSFLRRYKKPVIHILACGFVVNLFALCLPLFSSFVYDKVLGNGITETLWALAIGLFLIAVVEFSVRAVRTLVAERFSINSEADIDHSIFQGLLSSNSQTLPSIGRFLDRYKRLLSCRDFLSSSYILSLVDVPFLLFFLIAIVWAAGPLVFVPLFFGAVMLLGSLLTTVPLLDYDRQSRAFDEQRFRILTDLFTSHEVITSSALSKEFAARWRLSCSGVSTNQSLSRYWRTLGLSFSGSLASLAYISIIIGGVYMVDAHTLTSGGLLAASMLSSRTISGFSSIIMIVIRYREFKESLKDLDATLPAPQIETRKACSKKLSGNILCSNISCRMSPGSSPVLSSINLKIDAGEIVGIAGMPGAGKTTLLRLIAGIATPDEGNILIDHYPISSLLPDDIATTIGYKPQDLCLVEGTIESNIQAGRAPLSPSEREQILQMSGLSWAFQHGGLNWSTEVGARGSALSGGQRQLVAIARALLNAPPIILLDEPTNGLDTQLENHLARQFTSLKGHSTILVCTHSRPLLAACDRIIALGNSRILADGPRDKILVA